MTIYLAPGYKEYLENFIRYPTRQNWMKFRRLSKVPIKDIYKIPIKDLHTAKLDYLYPVYSCSFKCDSCPMYTPPKEGYNIYGVYYLWNIRCSIIWQYLHLASHSDLERKLGEAKGHLVRLNEHGINSYQDDMLLKLIQTVEAMGKTTRPPDTELHIYSNVKSKLHKFIKYPNRENARIFNKLFAPIFLNIIRYHNQDFPFTNCVSEQPIKLEILQGIFKMKKGRLSDKILIAYKLSALLDQIKEIEDPVVDNVIDLYIKCIQRRYHGSNSDGD